MCWPRLTCSKGLSLNRHWSKRILYKIVTLADCIQETCPKWRSICIICSMYVYIYIYIYMINRRNLRGNLLLNQRYHPGRPGLIIPSKVIKSHKATLCQAHAELWPIKILTITSDCPSELQDMGDPFAKWLAAFCWVGNPTCQFDAVSSATANSQVENWWILCNPYAIVFVLHLCSKSASFGWLWTLEQQWIPVGLK